MLLLFFTFIVYVFFIYGIVEFLRKVYIDFTRSNKSYNPPPIKVLVDNQEDIEYTIRSLQKNYNKMIILLTEDIQIPKTIGSISDNINIEFKRVQKETDAGRC